MKHFTTNPTRFGKKRCQRRPRDHLRWVSRCSARWKAAVAQMNINGQMHLIKQETFLRQQGTKNCRSQDFFNLYATPSHQHITKSLFSRSLLHGGLLLCTTSKLSSGVHLISINVHLESPICPCFCTYLSTGTIICHSLNCKSKTCPTLAWL